MNLLLVGIITMLSMPTLYAGQSGKAFKTPYVAFDTRCAADIIEFEALSWPMEKVIFPEPAADYSYPGIDTSIQHMQGLFQYPSQLKSVIPLDSQEIILIGVRFAQKAKKYQRSVMRNQELPAADVKYQPAHVAIAYHVANVVRSICMQPAYTQSLVDLCIRNNNLGEFPDGLNALKSLRYLDISHNHIVDGIPPQLWSQLRYFNISHNQLERLGTLEARKEIFNRYPELLVSLAPNPLPFEDRLLDSRARMLHDELWLLPEELLQALRLIIGLQ